MSKPDKDRIPAGWTECPSVTPGGKPTFFVSKMLELSVVWNRLSSAWVIEDRKAGVPLKLGNSYLYKNAGAAMRSANNWNKKEKQKYEATH